MTFLRNIFYFSLLMGSYSFLVNAQAPNWSNPVPLYMTPGSELGGVIIVKADSFGNGVILYPTIGNRVSFGGAACLSNSGVITYPLMSTPLSGGRDEWGIEFNRALSVSQTSPNNGDAIGVWLVRNPNNFSASLQVAKLSAGSLAWGEPTVLTVNPSGMPQVYLYSNGTAMAVWAEYQENDAIYYYSSRFNGSAWGSKLLITTTAGDIAPLFMDLPGGEYPIVVYNDVNNAIKIALFNGTSWTPSSIATSNNASAGSGALKAAAISSIGDKAAVVFVNASGTNVDMLHSVSTPLTSTAYGLTQNIIPGYLFEGVAAQPAIQTIIGLATAYKSNGDLITVITTQNVDTSSTIYIFINGSFNSSTGTTPGATYLSTSLAVDGNNNAFIVWQENNLNSSYINFSFLADSGGLSQSGFSMPGSSYSNPMLAVSPSGNAIITWIKNNFTIEAVYTTANTYIAEEQNNQANWFECVQALPQ